MLSLRYYTGMGFVLRFAAPILEMPAHFSYRENSFCNSLMMSVRACFKDSFDMYSGKKKRVLIRFINPLLDAAVERFGTADAQYSAVDDRHFTVSAEVEISDLFYGWLLSFGRRVKILYPVDVLEDFRAYIEKMRDMYMPEEE